MCAWGLTIKLSGCPIRAVRSNVVLGGAMEWISTKNKLPDDGQNVICAAKMDGETWWFGCCKYMGFFPWIKFDNPDPVEFWMPLPAPPNTQ